MPFFEGFLLSGSLIIAIGAQNAYVLKIGLLQKHVFIVAFICAFSDAFLMSLGIAGLSYYIKAYPLLLKAITIGGFIFLMAYGSFAFKRAFKPDIFKESVLHHLDLKQIILTCLAFTYLNPHCYLDTILLVGGLANNSKDPFQFGLGAVTSSFIWFFSLGFGARFLKPYFQNPLSWQVLDFSIGCIMWYLAFSLII